MNNENSEATSGLSQSLYSENILRAFVGKNSDFYISKWKKAKDPSKRAGWNWAGFLVGVFWLGYRKIYKILFLLLGLFILIDMVQVFIGIDFTKGVSAGLAAAFGVGGNTFYYSHMNEKLNTLKQNSQDDGELEELARKAGGATWKGVGITVLLMIAYVIVSSILEIVVSALFNIEGYVG